MLSFPYLDGREKTLCNTLSFWLFRFICKNSIHTIFQITVFWLKSVFLLFLFYSFFFWSPHCFVFFQGEEINCLQKSHVFNMQKLKNSELRLTEAKQKMGELALNIKMKEELIKELVRTGKWLKNWNEDIQK